MTSSLSQYDWDAFVLNLKPSDTEYLNALKGAPSFSVQRSPQISFINWRVAPHVIDDFRALREGAPTGKTDGRVSNMIPEEAHSKSESNRVTSERPDQDSISTHRTASSSPISSIRLQLDAPFLTEVEYPHATLDIIRFFLTRPCTIHGEKDSIFQTSSALSILKSASTLLRNVPSLLDRHTGGSEQKNKSFSGPRNNNNVPPINILLEKLFTEPKLLLELMNVGKIKSSNFLFEKVPIPPFIKPPVLRMSLSVENLVVGMVNKEVMEPFYGSIALYYRTSIDNNQHGLYRVSESQYIDMNCLSTLRNFACNESEPDSKALSNRLMTIIDTIERSKIVEFTIPLSSQISLDRIFLVVFLEKTIGVSSDEAHEFYSKIRNLENDALMDEEIRSKVDRYSLYLQRLAEGVACHDIRMISGIINNKFSPNRHDTIINREIVHSLSQAMADGSQSDSSNPTSQAAHQSRTKKKSEPKKSERDSSSLKYPGGDAGGSGSVSESKVPTNIFTAYGEKGEQILAECNKYFPKVKAAIKHTGGLRETFAVSISPIFPLSAFSLKEEPVSKRATRSQGAASSIHNIDLGTTRATFDQEASALPDSFYYNAYQNLPNQESQPHVLTRNISLMGVPPSTLKSEDSTLNMIETNVDTSQRKSDIIFSNTTVSIQQLENFLSLAKIIYSKNSDIKRQDGMEKRITLRELWEANCLLNPDDDAYIHLQNSATDGECKELINRIYEYFVHQKKCGAYSMDGLKDDPLFSGTEGNSRLAFVHPFQPVTHRLNTFVKLPRNISQAEPFSSVLLNIYNDRASRKRALNYIQLYINTSINTFGTYDLDSKVFKATRDAPSYYTLQPNHLPDYTHSIELMVWSYCLSLLEKGDHDELLLLMKHGYLNADTLSHLLLFALMNSKQLSSQHIYLALRDAATTLEHKKRFSSLQSHYFFDKIRGSRHHPSHIYIKQLDCFFHHEVGTPAAPFKNRVYLYPQYFIVTLPNIQCRAFFLKVEMRSDDRLDNKDIMWTIYPRLHGSMSSNDIAKGRIVFRSSYLTSAVANSRSARLHDEIKFELPLYITPKTHFLFTLYGVSEPSKKDKNHVEKCALSTIVGVDDSVFVPQEKTATNFINCNKFISLYANPMHYDSTIDNSEQTLSIHRTIQGKMSASSASSISLRHMNSLPVGSSQCANTYRAEIQDPTNQSSIQHIVEEKTQLSLLGYAYLPLVKGVDELGIPVLQNTLGVDLQTQSVVSNSEFIESHDKSILISFQSHISAGYLSSQSDKERPQQGSSDSNSKKSKQVGYVSCTIRYESSLYTHFHFLNAIYYVYTCTKNIVLKSCIDFDKTIKILRGFCENINRYATDCKIFREKYSGRYTNSLLEDLSIQITQTNKAAQPQPQVMASERKYILVSEKNALLEYYGSTLEHCGSAYNIAVAMASMLMHNQLLGQVISRESVFKCLEYIFTPFTAVLNNRMAITNNLYHHCINEEIASAFKAQKTFGKCSSWFMMLRNFSYTPFLEAMLTPLFGSADTTQYLLDSEFQTLSDIYKSLCGIGNYISFSNKKSTQDMIASGPFRQDSLILTNLAIYIMVAHYTYSITTFQDLQNYIFYLHDKIIDRDNHNSSVFDRILETIPHNLLLISRSFMITLAKYRHLYNADMSCFLSDDMDIDAPGASNGFEATHLSNTVASCDNIKRERGDFEADLIAFINSAIKLIKIILSKISDVHHTQDSHNKAFTITTSLAKFFIIITITSPKKTKLFGLIKSHIESLENNNNRPEISTQLNEWKILFDFLNQLVKENSLLYSYSFTDIHIKELFIFKESPSDPSNSHSKYTLPPFNLIPQACIVPYLYLKALHYLISIPISRLSLPEDHASFRSICIDIFTLLWEICSEDISRQTQSFLYISSVPLLLLILNNYDTLFFLVNERASVEDRTNQIDDIMSPTTSDQNKDATPTDDTVVTKEFLSNFKTEIRQLDSDNPITPRTPSGPSHSDVPAAQVQNNDFSLELIVTEMFLFLIIFLQRLTNYHAEFFRNLTVEQAQNMLKIYSHVPFLFDEKNLKKKAVTLTSTSYRVQSIRYLSFLLSNDSTFSDNIFSPQNGDATGTTTPPFSFISSFHRDSSNPQGSNNLRRLSSLLDPPVPESSTPGSLFLFSEMIADVFMAKELKYTSNTKQSGNTGQNPLSVHQYTSTNDPYSKSNKNATASTFSSSQMFYHRDVPLTARGTVAQGASTGSYADSNAPNIPRNPTKDYRGSAASKSGQLNAKKHASRARARQEFKISIQASQTTLATSDDTDGTSIYRDLDDSIDIQGSQCTLHKRYQSIRGSTEDPTKEEDSTNDGRDLSYSFSANHRDRDKDTSMHRLTGHYAPTDSTVRQALLPIFSNDPNHKRRPPSQEEIDEYLKMQIKANKLILLDPNDSKFGQQMSSNPPSNEDNASGSRHLCLKPSDPLYLKLIKNQESTRSVTASLLSIIVYESTLYQLLTFTQHLIVNSDKNILPDTGTKNGDSDNRSQHNIFAVHAELIHTFAHFLTEDRRFSVYNEIVLNALINYLPSIASILFVALESKRFSFERSISMVIRALLNKINLEQRNMYNLAATIIVILFKMEFDHHASIFILFSMINYFLVTINLTDEKKKDAIVLFFNYVLDGVAEICSNDEAWIGKGGDDDPELYKMTLISGKLSLIYKHFYSTISLFHARLLIVIESEYRIQERSTIVSEGKTITDLDLYTELKLSQADCYVGQVELRLFSLQSLFNFLKENGRHVEAAMVSLLISGLISEYLIVRPEFSDIIANHPDLPPVYSLAKIVIPELRKIMPDITVQGDLDIWLAYIAKAQHIMGKNENMYSSLDGDQFFKLLNALWNAAAEFTTIEFHIQAKHVYRLIMMLSEKYYHSISSNDNDLHSFAPEKMMLRYTEALKTEEKGQKRLLSPHECMNYYWVSITTVSNEKESSIEYIYCRPHSERIGEFIRWLQKFYNPPDSQKTKGTKIDVQKVDCYRQEHSAAILTEEERLIKQKILMHMLSYNMDMDDKVENPEDSLLFLEESYSNPHLTGARTEPSLHIARNILSQSHRDRMPANEGISNKSKFSASYYSNIIYNYYPFVLASAEDFADVGGLYETLSSFISRQIFYRRIQRQSDSNDSSTELPGCLNVYYYTAHPFPHTNSRQRVIYFYEEYTSPIQEAIKIIEKAIYDAKSLLNEKEVNKVFQNLTGIVMPTVNSGIMDIVRTFLKKKNEPRKDLEFNVQVVSFDDLVSSTAIPLAEKRIDGNFDAPIVKDPENNTIDADAAIENQENSGESSASPQILPQNSMFFYDQDRENTSSPMAGIIADQSMQKVQSNELMETNTTDDASYSPYSNTGTILSKSITKRDPSATLRDPLPGKSKSSRKEAEDQDMDSDETNSRDFFAPEERLTTIKASLTLNLSHHQSLAVAPFSSAINSSLETSSPEDSERLENIALKASSNYFALCPGFLDLFLSDSAYSKLIEKTDLPIKNYWNPQRYHSNRANHALRQGSYLTGDSTQHGSSRESRQYKLLAMDKQYIAQSDLEAHSVNSHGTCRESGYHGRFTIAQFTSNSDHDEVGSVLLPADITEKINTLRNKLPMRCKAPNSLTNSETDLCRKRLEELIIELMNLQPHTFNLAHRLMGSNYERLYSVVLETFFKMLDELEEYVDFNKEEIKKKVTAQELPLF